VRTVPERVYDLVRDGDFGILEAYTRALRSARELIYLENQFLWSSEIAEILQEKLDHPPSDDFRMVLVLPARPNDGSDDTRGQLGDLIDCDGGAGRLLACSLYALGELGPQQVYVHAKIGIVDDRWLTLGSANLNEHSLFNDTEVNVLTCDEQLALETRLRLWSEHLQRPAREISGPPARVVDALWKPIAEEQARRRAAGEPLTHRLCLLPGLSHRTRRLLGPINGLLVDG
jgi:phosphatidylserine/phosphatidylglycerophosphate/cardiolipin synthase-like enzyme